MPFSEPQIKRLSGKLDGKHVKTRELHGHTLSYLEGWHVIAEANRIFGFDGWDRETAWAECVWAEARREPKMCAYAARVRVRVRAGETIICRDGSGVGHGSGATLGEAHESALKEAETDATKRALTTFGNLFGLALYDKDRAGVRDVRKRSRADIGESPLRLLFSNRASVSTHDRPQSFCTAIRAALEAAVDLNEIALIWDHNVETVMLLRSLWPDLKTRQGVHYADVIEKLHRQQVEKLSRRTDDSPLQPEPLPILMPPRRLRDAAHLRFVATLPCVVCGRAPSHAHHLLFAQPRAMGRKVSDEWAIPLCLLHHRALHDAGDEERWWNDQRIDPRAEAERLWQQSRNKRELRADYSDVADEGVALPRSTPFQSLPTETEAKDAV
ncbi:MAG: hypothetical protein JWL84_3289 [Rhodospirillales bacterium]|nr:hypothetical protein [Rhodospirillales bacterium]